LPIAYRELTHGLAGWVGQGVEMSIVSSQPAGRISSRLIRVPIIINFVLFLMLISPVGRNRNFYKAMRGTGLAAFITTALQVWVVGATLFVTSLFLWRKIRKSDAVMGQPPRKAPLDAVLLLAWWIVLVLACLYAFMMGLGG
jgi:hypothetical protein